MSFRSALLAAAALLATANAHITMADPVPYSLEKLDNGPITAEQFPCKSQNGFTVTTMNQIKVGEKKTATFKGSAVHGGGSCQLSYTQDTTPTKNSKFKVITSIEGGCPGVEGGTKPFEYTLPDSIPNGKGTFAWTWFAKMSGAPEMYMNCAPIEVTGGASDASKLDALPDMLVANIASTTCKSPLNKALKFPNPGQSLQSGGTNDLEAPTGECGATGSTPPAASSGPTQPSPSVSVPSASPIAKPSPSAGGVFAPGASSAAPAPVKPSPTTLVAVPSAPSASTTPAKPTGAPTTGPPATGGGACSTNGAIVCNGATQFGICNNGSIVWQQVAAGTTCTNGVISKRGYNGRIARPRVLA